MIVHNFNIMRSICLPAEADSKLVIDPDGVLTSPVALESLQFVSWWGFKVGQVDRSFNLIQLAESDSADRLPAFIRASFKEFLCIGVFETLYHMDSILRHALYDKQSSDRQLALRRAAVLFTPKARS